MRPRIGRERDGVVVEVVVDVDARGDCLERGDVRGVQHGAQRGRVDAVGAKHERLLASARVPHDHAHEEAVDLRLRKRVGAFEVDRVLRRQDEEGERKLEAIAFDRDLTLLHGLEERGLRLRGSAVDLVREHDVREDRSGAEAERAVLR